MQFAPLRDRSVRPQLKDAIGPHQDTDAPDTGQRNSASILLLPYVTVKFAFLLVTLVRTALVRMRGSARTDAGSWAGCRLWWAATLACCLGLFYVVSVLVQHPSMTSEIARHNPELPGDNFNALSSFVPKDAVTSVTIAVDALDVAAAGVLEHAEPQLLTMLSGQLIAASSHKGAQEAERSGSIASAAAAAQEAAKGLRMSMRMGRHKTPALSQWTSLGGRDSPDHAYMAMCLTVKDQNRDILEWVEHHLSLGIGKIYIYDHNSDIPMIRELYPLVDAGVLEYHYYKEFKHPSNFPQTWVYEMCLQKHAQSHRWMGFWDADEFLLINSKQGKDVRTLLPAYESFGGVAINVRVLGSSGHQERPASGTTLTNYVSCLPLTHPDNLHVKIIVQTEYIVGPAVNPHEFRFQRGKFAVSPTFEKVHGPKSKVIDRETFIIHHYATKSRSEFQEHIARGSASGVVGKTIEFLEWADNESKDSCTDALASR